MNTPSGLEVGRVSADMSFVATGDWETSDSSASLAPGLDPTIQARDEEVMRLMRVRQELIGPGALGNRDRSSALARGWLLIGGWLLVVVGVLAWVMVVPLIDALRSPRAV